MVNLEGKFSALLSKVIDKLFLVVWPPLGEVKHSHVDVAVGLVLLGQEDILHMISINKEDRWTPIILQHDLPKEVFPFSEFHNRISKWMLSELEEDLDFEFFDCQESSEFQYVVKQEIVDVLAICIEDGTPFGVKLTFENDYLLITATADGSTVESKGFCLCDNLKNFQAMGKISEHRLD